MQLKLIGERIKALREYRRLNSTELSTTSTVHLGTISAIERRPARVPDVDTLQKIAPALQVSVGFLLGEEDADIPFPQNLGPQALRIFLRDHGKEISDNDRERMTWISRLPTSPKSVEEWQAFLTNVQNW